MGMDSFSCILLDLGGVLYGVDYLRTVQALGLPPEALPGLLTDPALLAYEKGLLSTKGFLAHLRKRFPEHSLEALIEAWNAMLLGPLPQTPAILHALSRAYSLALLSNTNDLHLMVVEPDILPWSPYFEDMFFSNRLGQRKPDPDTYRTVLKKLGWNPEKTLFVDDSPTNIEGARQAGLQTLLLSTPNRPDLLLNLLPQPSQS
uniref:HAD family hydrolase n=1 Tax=uncultured Bacteroidota bacterium TaxID=152509 RepID=H5SNT9_9BACT|nr:HAD family hydrolase [uncultured Bacteroidetes bacterium]